MAAHRERESEIRVGSTLSQVRLSIHTGRTPNWIRLQGNTVQVRGETWRANFYNGGRIRDYTLVERAASETAA